MQQRKIYSKLAFSFVFKFRFSFYKLKYFTILLLSLFIQINCKNKDDTVILPLDIEKKELIRLTYALDDPSQESKYLQPVFEIEGEDFCFHSRSIGTKDLGPRLSICLDKYPSNKSILDEVTLAFENPLQAQSYPDFLIQSSEEEIRIDFPTESSIVKEWKKVPPLNWILLDDSLRNRINENRTVWMDASLSSLAKSYSLPYWNYVEGNSCYFLIRSWNLDVSKTARRFLRISLPCDFISPKIRQFIESANTRNEKFRAECIQDVPVIQEVFQSTSSRLNRFLEWKNASEFTICLDEIKFINSKTGETENVLWDNNDLGFLFPRSHLLFIHADSDLEGKILPDTFPWLEVFKKEQSFLIKQGISEVEIFSTIESNIKAYKEEDEYFSQDFYKLGCADQKFIYTSSEKICATPGYSFMEKEDSGRYCRPIDVQLTEIQAKGILDSKGNSFTQDRFLEFQIRTKDGKASCDISALLLKVGTDSFPLSAQEMILSNGDIFLVSLSDKLKEQRNVIPRSLSRLKWESEIVLQDLRNKELDKIFRTLMESQFVEFDSKGTLYSLEWRGEFLGRDLFLHHRKVIQQNLPSSSTSQNSSPGMVVDPRNLSLENFPIPNPLVIDSSHAVQLTELLWSGSYSESISILDDRFVEWKSESLDSDSLLLELEFPGYPSRSQSYLIPNQMGIHTLSKKELQCFPKSNNLFHKDFALYHSDTKLRLIDPISLGLLDEIEIDTSEYGMNSTSSKLRRSAVKNQGTNSWQTSEIESGFCKGQTFASPGEYP